MALFLAKSKTLTHNPPSLTFFFISLHSEHTDKTVNKNGTRKRHRIMRLLARLPLSMLYLVSDLAYPILYYIIRYRRRLVHENLRCSFPEKSHEELLCIEKKFYRNLCDVFIEAFKCLHISDQELRRRVEVLNCELPERIAAEGKNVFMLLGHLGCWEWYQEVSVRYKAPRKGAEIYKEIKSPYFASLMREVRSRWDTEQIEMKQTVRSLLRWAAEGEPFLCGFIMDQRMGKAKDWVNFLCQKTSVVPGPEELAKKTNAVLVYLDAEKLSRGHYRLTFRELTVPEDFRQRPYPLTLTFFHNLEESIRRQPELWLWSHNRWSKKDYV